MPELEVFQFPILSDNYAVLLHHAGTGRTAAIDAADAESIADALRARRWRLTDIFVTHHHGDHTAGVAALKQMSGATVHGPAAESVPIPALDRPLAGGARFDFAGRQVQIIDAPGHTRGHIVYHLPEDRLAFVGDVLFSLGCGRVTEGTMDEMWTSLDKLRRLAPDTVVYCGHEYTLANARFALTVEPANIALQKRAEEAAALRDKSLPTLPTTIAAERAANPFLRPESAEIRRILNMPDASDAAVFAELRERKNRA